MDRPLFSVVMPVRDQAPLIGRSIASVLAQTLGDLELIVVDDGSTDASADVAETVGDPRVKVLRRPHSGVCASRNAGVGVATGRFLTFLDSDDEAEQDWLSAYAGVLSAGGAEAVRAGALVVDPEGREAFEPARERADNPGYPYGACLPGSYATSVARFLAVGGFSEVLQFSENTELLIRLLASVRAEGHTVPVLGQAVVHIHRRRDRHRQYGSAPAQAAAFLLDRHGPVIRSDPQLHQDYLSILGTDRLRRGSRGTAALYLARAWRARPGARAALRLASVLAPPQVVARRTGARSNPALRVLVACPGAGRIARGYESFTIQLAAQLQLGGDLDAVLVQGGRPAAPWAVKVPCLRQERRPAALLARLLRTHPKFVEQFSFGLSSLAVLAAFRPDVVVVSEHGLATVYAHARSVPGLGHSVVYHNGGLHRLAFPRFDVVHQVTPTGVRSAIAAGASPDRNVLIPCALLVGPQPPSGPAADERRRRLRTVLGLPFDQDVVVSVGRLDCSLKHMDHVVREVAALDEPPFLVLLGAPNDETPALEALARRLLGGDGYRLATVDADEVPSYYEAADVFTMAGRQEGFGLVYVEALAAGLPCIVDDNPVTRYVLGDLGTFVDMTQPGALSQAIAAALAAGPTPEDRQQRWVAAKRFDWDVLRPEYERLVVDAHRARQQRPAGPHAVLAP